MVHIPLPCGTISLRPSGLVIINPGNKDIRAKWENPEQSILDWAYLLCTGEMFTFVGAGVFLLCFATNTLCLDLLSSCQDT